MNSLTKSILITLVPLIALPGCSSAPTNKTKETASSKETTSLIDFTLALQSNTSTGLDGPLGGALRGLTRAIDAIDPSKDPSPDRRLNEHDHEIVKRPGYNAIATWWCPRDKDVFNKDLVSNKYGEVCRARKGNWNSPYCEDNIGNPLFLAATTSARYCTGGYATAAVYVVEPTSSPYNQEYLRALKASRFPTPREQTEKELAESARQELTALNAEKVRNQAQRGSRICNTSQKITTAAFVLSRAPSDKLEIRIQDVWMGNRSMGVTVRPNGGGPYGRPGDIVFITPAEWQFCE